MQQRDDIVQVCQTMYKRGYITATDGNVSVRTDSGFLVTPSAMHKGALSADQIVACNQEGQPLADQNYKPSGEFLMHMQVYRQRPDIHAVIHAHPVFAVAFSVAGKSLADPILSEVVLTLGSVPTVPYCTPTTQEVPDAIAPYINDHQAMILERHGSLCYAHNLQEAYFYLERLEHAAQILYYAHQLGSVTPLSPEQVEKLKRLTLQT